MVTLTLAMVVHGVLCYMTWSVSDCYDASTCSAPTTWVAMAPKARKVAKRHGAMKTAHRSKSKTRQNHQAKVHQVTKKPSQAQAKGSRSQAMGDAIQEEQEKGQEEAQQEEHEGECHEDEDETAEKDKTKVSGKEYHHFLEPLSEAPRAVQEAVQKVKGQPKRVGKPKQVADMAKAYVKQKRDHKLFKSIEPLEQERPQAREDVVMPKVIMEAKRGGKSAFEQAICLANSNVLSRFQIVSFVFACLFSLALPRHWLMVTMRRWRTQRMDQTCFGW